MILVVIEADSFMNEGLALRYFDKLTSDLSQGVIKSIAGADQNTRVNLKYKPKHNMDLCYN